MSSRDVMFDVSQAVELKSAFCRNGWSNEEIKILSKGNILGEVLKVIKGQAEIKMIEHLIDCDVNPYVPDSWTVEEHKKGGLWKWNPKISFYLSERQKNGSLIGTDLRKELVNRPVLNANVLDWLLGHSELIPEEWKDKVIFFWGTIYRVRGGNLCVRYLYWRGSCWRWDYYWLDGGFDSDGFAALAS